MKNFWLRLCIVCLTVWTLSMTVSLFGFAQQVPTTNLQVVPKEKDRAIVPVSQTIINVDLWFNKQCGSPYATGEKIAIYFKADADGYVTLYDIDTRGNVSVVFPNIHLPDNYVKAGQTYMIPNEQYTYDLMVEGPEGIEYINAVASTDPYYHWDYNRGEPDWLYDWGLVGKRVEPRDLDQTTLALQNSTEYRNLPKEFGQSGLQSLTHNFQLSQMLSEQIRSKIIVQPRQTGQPTGTVENYNTASCYLYVVSSAAPPPQPQQTAQQVVPVSRKKEININLAFDKQCGGSYFAGDQFAVYFTTDTDGYVTLYNINTKGDVSVIFPNMYIPDNYVRAGQTYAIPKQNSSFLVEGPAGVMYADAMASTDPYYHWNYNQGEPRWLSEWGLSSQTKREIGETGQAAALHTSPEYQNLPQEIGQSGLQNLTRNFQLSQNLREQVRAKIVVQPRQTGQPTGTTEGYSTASCYTYVVEKAPPRQQPTPQRQPVTPVAQPTINVNLWFDKQCGSPYSTGEKIIIYFKADVDGYVTLYDIDTKGNVSVLFPNKHLPDNYVKAGQTYVIPNERYTYDLIVEGPEGIEYIDAVASTDQYYHWDYNKGEPEWLDDWGLKGQKSREIQVLSPDQTAVAFKSSTEYQQAPQEFGALGLQSLTNNFQLSQNLREQVRTELGTRPRAITQQTRTQIDYNTASCYLYVVEGSQPSQTVMATSQVEYLQQQELAFQQIPSITIRRAEDRLIVEMPGEVLFASNSYDLQYDARQALNQVASILLRYPNTDIVVMGHTDSVGSLSYNQTLSEYRAQSVGNYLVQQGVEAYRISWIGYGESMPIASNDTEAGRQRNRRVELSIKARE